MVLVPASFIAGRPGENCKENYPCDLCTSAFSYLCHDLDEAVRFSCFQVCGQEDTFVLIIGVSYCQTERWDVADKFVNAG